MLVPFYHFNRGIIFLDPFGMQFEWNTIEKIANTRALEIFMNFPVMAINRTVLMNNPHRLNDSQIERMNRFWGSTEWKVNIYEEVPDLLDGTRIEKISQTGESLGLLFQRRLEQIFPEVTYPLVMKNSKGAPLYCLIFAGHNGTGKNIMENIFKNFERL